MQQIKFSAAKIYDHVSELLGRLGWPSAEELVSFHALSPVLKVRCSGEPEVLVAELTIAETRGRDLADVTRQDRQFRRHCDVTPSWRWASRGMGADFPRVRGLVVNTFGSSYSGSVFEAGRWHVV